MYEERSSSLNEQVGLLDNAYKQINELVVAIMCTTLKNYSWRTLLPNPADDAHQIPSGKFMCGVDCKGYGHAALILPIDPYWAMMRDKVQEVDHAYPVDSNGFARSVEIICNAAHDFYGKVNVRGGFANQGVDVDMVVKNGQVLVPGIHMPINRTTGEPLPDRGYTVSSSSINDRDEDEELLDRIEKTGKINRPRSGFVPSEQFGGGHA